MIFSYTIRRTGAIKIARAIWFLQNACAAVNLYSQHHILGIPFVLAVIYLYTSFGSRYTRAHIHADAICREILSNRFDLDTSEYFDTVVIKGSIQFADYGLPTTSMRILNDGTIIFFAFDRIQ